MLNLGLGLRNRRFVSSDAGITYLLDEYPGATAAFSLRRLSTNQTGNLLKIRNSDNNDEIFIGLDGDWVDTETALDFANGSSVHVVSWYGINNLVATQPVSTSQPRLINNGAIETLGNKPAMFNTNSNSGLVCTLDNNFTSNEFSAISRAAYTTAGYFDRLFTSQPSYGGYDFNNPDSFVFLLKLFGLDVIASFYNNSQGASQNISSNTPYIFSSLATNGTSKTRVNGTSIDTNIPQFNSLNIEKISLGHGFGGNDSWNGYYSDFLLYPTNQESNIEAIENNINSVYQ